MIILVSSIANAGGLGGGAVIIPVYIFFFNYVAAEAIPMSKATILAGAIVNVAMTFKRK
jgi:uncharacterized membrane protein YfcA